MTHREVADRDVRHRCGSHDVGDRRPTARRARSRAIASGPPLPPPQPAPSIARTAPAKMITIRGLSDGCPSHRSSSVPSADSVSYTHLRAHETDSYLVCRLL